MWYLAAVGAFTGRPPLLCKSCNSALSRLKMEMRLAVIENETELAWDQLERLDSQEQNRYNELVWSRGGATTAGQCA